MHHWLERLWCRFGKNGKPNGCDYDRAARALIEAASHRGVWDPFGAVRGRGAWRGENDKVVYHSGNAVFIDGKWRDPGKIGDYVYPRCKATPRPWPDAIATGARGPGAQFLQLAQTWRWKRSIDSILLLGWVGAAMMAGAIPWRPVIWVTGGRGTGKSTLHHLIEMLFGDALIAVSDASAAGIWQKLRFDALPVLLDEVEAEEDPRRGQALIKFARQAASGGLVLRGGSDHGAAEFMARSCFLFSSILVPPLLSQDRSRIAILELGELGDAPPIELDRRKLGEMGQRLLRRLIESWERWDETLAMSRRALTERGHSARGADVFGTLIAMADILLHEGHPHRDSIDEFADQLNIGSLAEAEDDTKDEERCLAHLFTQSIPLDTAATNRPVAEWLRRAAALSPTEDEDPAGVTNKTMDEAKAVLGRYGMAAKHVSGQLILAIATVIPSWASCSTARIGQGAPEPRAYGHKRSAACQGLSQRAKMCGSLARARKRRYCPSAFSC